MVEMIMRRMEIVESILETTHSEWAKQHWTQVLEYFRRQLKQLGNV